VRVSTIVDVHGGVRVCILYALVIALMFSRLCPWCCSWLHSFWRCWRPSQSISWERSQNLRTRLWVRSKHINLIVSAHSLVHSVVLFHSLHFVWSSSLCYRSLDLPNSKLELWKLSVLHNVLFELPTKV
jgi:hypothetical protein